MTALKNPSKRYVLAVMPRKEFRSSLIHEGSTGPASCNDPNLVTEFGKLLNEEIFSGKFRREIWTKKHAYFSGYPGRFDSLISLDDIEGILAHSSPDNNRIQLAIDGGYVEEIELCDPSTLTPASRPKRFDIPKFELLLRKGATLIINGIDEVHKPIGALAADFESLIGAPAQVNLYASWGTTPGFKIHWDEHEVVVLQVKGSKEWRLYGKTTDYPIRTLTDIPRPGNEPLSTVILNDGDIFYLPRGHWHSVHPSAQFTIHLTIGLHTSNGLDFLQWIRNHLTSNSFVRSDVPQLDPLSSDLDKYAQEFGDVLGTIVNRESIASFVASRQSAIKPRSYVNLRHIHYLESRSLQNNTELRLVPLITDLFIQETEDLVTIDHAMKRIVLKKSAMPVLSVLFEVKTCTFGFILQSLSSTLPVDDISNIALELCEAGLVSLH